MTKLVISAVPAEKVLSPMVRVFPVGTVTVTLVKLSQSENALSPMEVTLLGIVMLVKLVQL